MKRYLIILALCGSVHADDRQDFEELREAAMAAAASYVPVHREYDPVIDYWGTANDPRAQQMRRDAERLSESVRHDEIIKELREIKERQEEILRQERCR